MKTPAPIFLTKAAILSAAVLASPGLAADTRAAGTATASILIPLHVEDVQHLHFGLINLDRGKAGHVQVDADGGAFHHFGADRARQTAALAGHFQVRGHRGCQFSVSLDPGLELTGGNTRKILRGRIHHIQVGGRAPEAVPESKSQAVFTTAPSALPDAALGVRVKIGATLALPAEVDEDHYMGRYEIQVLMP